MADEQKSGADRQRTDNSKKSDQNQGQGVTRLSTQAERDRQNRDDPSRAPESGDRK
jgi:hypothetical protein